MDWSGDSSALGPASEPLPSVVVPLPPAEVAEAQATVEAEYQDKPHRGSKTPYIIFGLAIALIVIFVMVVVVFFLLGNPPPTYQLSVINTTATDLAVILNNYPPIILSPAQTQIVQASPGALLTCYGYNTNVGASGPHTMLTFWLSNQSYTGTPYLSVNGVRQNAPPSNNTSDLDQYQISITEGYNLAIKVDVSDVSGAAIDTIGWAGTGQCPSNLLYPGPTGYYACATPCYTFGSSAEADYCCTGSNACGVTGVCLNSWTDTYADFRAVCSECNISACDQFIFGAGNTQGKYNPYQITFAPIVITPTTPIQA